MDWIITSQNNILLNAMKQMNTLKQSMLCCDSKVVLCNRATRFFFILQMLTRFQPYLVYSPRFRHGEKKTFDDCKNSKQLIEIACMIKRNSWVGRHSRIGPKSTQFDLKWILAPISIFLLISIFRWFLFFVKFNFLVISIFCQFQFFF